MAFLKFFPAPARARIIPPHLRTMRYGGRAHLIRIDRRLWTGSGRTRDRSHRWIAEHVTSLFQTCTDTGLRQLVFDCCFVGLQSCKLLFRLLQDGAGGELGEVELEEGADDGRLDVIDEELKATEALIL